MVMKDQCVSLKQFQNNVITLFRGVRKGQVYLVQLKKKDFFFF